MVLNGGWVWPCKNENCLPDVPQAKTTKDWIRRCAVQGALFSMAFFVASDVMLLRPKLYSVGEKEEEWKKKPM